MRAVAISTETYIRVTNAAVVALVVIVVTGAAVRLTGSGLGCSSWPGCEPGEFVPVRAAQIQPLIEFINRMITGLVSLLVVAAVLGSRWRVTRRQDLDWLAWGLVAGVFGQILLGALVVEFKVHPILVQGHFLLSAFLVADAVVLAHRARRPDGINNHPQPVVPAASRTCVQLSKLTLMACAVGLAAGTIVTATGPHAGDEYAKRLTLFSLRTAAEIHSLVNWAFLGLAVLLAIRLHSELSHAAERVRTLVSLIVLQGAIGYVQYFTGVPPRLVGAHVLGSMLVWIAVIRVHLGVLEPLPQTRTTS